MLVVPFAAGVAPPAAAGEPALTMPAVAGGGAFAFSFAAMVRFEAFAGASAAFSGQCLAICPDFWQ